jgi:CBS domain-containing protein
MSQTTRPFQQAPTRQIIAGDGSRSDQVLSATDRCGTTPARRPAHRSWVELLETELNRPAAHKHVGELMERKVLCVKTDVSVKMLASLFIERGLSGAPVVDENARLVGFVSFAEIVRDSVERGGLAEPEHLSVRIKGGGEYDLPEGFHSEEIAHATVGEIMTRVVVTLFAHDTVATAAALMAFEGVRRIPVIDDEGRVIGLLTTLDVITWIAAHSGYLVPEHHASWHR